ncbi:recombinase family protein [Eubacterium barkeri]|uniref:Site-specific DNA recombinase n=1 Tax=Eubacterium barkeri TaxID=1528 RepID=A0A1H3HFU9_EUBBA|nr:recombinase family protein [Eubacterium barkeri]SDY14347.1 site-specific DNA recombinase [Eubacterium barkeri]
MNNCVVYARFSSDNQRDESIDAQVRACRDFCKRSGMIITHIYADEARSATTDRRPEFQQMIADSASGDFKFVLVHKLDRFSRDRYDSAFYKRQLKNNGVRLMSVLENLDDSPESIILESVLEGMAEYYSRNLAREVMKGQLENAYKCKHTGGRTPYGFSLNGDKQLIINPEEAEVVRVIYEMYTRGDGYKAICTRLDEMRARTRNGRNFSAGTVREILTNEKYSGVYVFNRSAPKANGKRNNHASKSPDEIIRIPGGCPAIVSEETFRTVKTRMSKNLRTGGRYNAKRMYILSGVIHCGACGGGMSGSSIRGGRSKKLYHYYICNSKKYNKSCKAKSINADTAEDLVLRLLLDKAMAPTAIHSAAEAVLETMGSIFDNQSQRLDELKSAMSSIDTQIANLIAVISEGVFSPAIKSKLEDLEHRRDELEKEIRKISSSDKSDVPKSVLSVEKSIIQHKDLLRSDRTVQRTVIDEIVDDIRVFPDRLECDVNFFRLYPVRLSPP